MGFTTGLTGGVTVTLGLAYLTVLAHERNRQAQALYLRSQSQLLNSLIDPAPIQPPTRSEIARQTRETFVETAKDRWNGEIENAIRWVQTTDWTGVREGMEGTIARMLGLGLEKSREGIEEAEQKLKPTVQEAVDRSKAAASRGTERVADVVEQVPDAARSSIGKLASSTKEGLNQAGARAQEIASATTNSATKAASDMKAGADRAITSTRDAMARGADKSHEMAEKVQAETQSTGAGTVDAARSALRNVVSKGIEKGKEIIDHAQSAVGITTGKAKPASSSSGPRLEVSDVEKALRERYNKPNGLSRTAEEVLAERYKPINERDNTVLRGV